MLSNNHKQWKLTTFLTIVAAFILVIGSGIVQARTIYVDASVAGGDGGPEVGADAGGLRPPGSGQRVHRRGENRKREGG